MKKAKRSLSIVLVAASLALGSQASVLWAGGAPQMMGGPMHDPAGSSMRGMMQKMMGGRLPPGINPAFLPEPRSEGARLLQKFCTQCHKLPGPGRHIAAEWPPVVARMNMRMRMMSRMGMTMMGRIAAPTEHEVDVITAYLEKYAQKPINPEKYPGLDSRAGKAFSFTCAQCHALPDPKQHTAREWPSVVERMKGHEAVMGKIIPDNNTTNEIIEFLKRRGRTGK
ncbi:MAG TPA: hypothetical protein DEP05_09255 [Betaproteobacteria bacterium]|nr:hypothetical protein [Betaproteobacteria bacterium]